MSRILAVDPGDKRIGLAISDLSGTIANPLTVIEHVSRMVDAAVIAQKAYENEVMLIVVGQALDSEGQVGPQGRKAQRMADAIKEQTQIEVILWDESHSTQTAREARILMGVNRNKRKGHMDELAATVILQTYLDFRKPASQE
ncbi:MAG: Holliday junction resolvase RuvX [Anaerolineae bacterium]|nr:Holliday junction resolvase RuvX [Anaerolineae bacterium]